MIAPIDEAIQLKDCKEPASPSGSNLARWTIKASVIASEKASDKEPVAIMAIVVGAGLPLWLLVSTRYELSATDLYIFSGPFSWRVPLREVKSISPTRSVLASPALSFDRLRIDHGRFDSIMISPREKDRFIDELEARRAALS